MGVDYSILNHSELLYIRAEPRARSATLPRAQHLQCAALSANGLLSWTCRNFRTRQRIMRLGLAVLSVLPMVTRFSADGLKPKALSPACSSGIQYDGAQKHDPVQHLMGMLACWILNDDAR